MEGEGEDDVMQWKQFGKLDVSVISAGRHCRVTVFTISVDANFLKVESKEKVAVAETRKQGKEAKAGVATLTIGWVDFPERKQRA